MLMGMSRVKGGKSRGLRLIISDMSGHSKWATIHRSKEVKDAKRGNLFSKLGRAISIAVKSGGGPDASANFKLRVAIEKARAADMPKDNIERAISKGGGAALEETVYEGFGPGGIGVLVEVATDNKNRTGSEIKSIFERGGGSLAGPGAVSFNFEQKGFMLIKKTDDPESQMLKLIEAGVEDVEETGDGIEVYTAPSQLSEVRKNLESQGFEISTMELYLEPKTLLTINEVDAVKKATGFLESLEEHDDVQKVYSNLDVPENLLNV